VSPIALLFVSLVVLAVGLVLTAATSRANETALDSTRGAARIVAAIAVLADVAGVVGAGVAVVLLLKG
jgi:ABC-type Zn uptake system ZnuABC Zn-binding protein ZnuA